MTTVNKPKLRRVAAQPMLESALSKHDWDMMLLLIGPQLWLMDLNQLSVAFRLGEVLRRKKYAELLFLTAKYRASTETFRSDVTRRYFERLASATGVGK